jgi:hypothetical protein
VDESVFQSLSAKTDKIVDMVNLREMASWLHCNESVSRAFYDADRMALSASGLVFHAERWASEHEVCDDDGYWADEDAPADLNKTLALLTKARETLTALVAIARNSSKLKAGSVWLPVVSASRDALAELAATTSAVRKASRQEARQMARRGKHRVAA